MIKTDDGNVELPKLDNSESYTPKKRGRKPLPDNVREEREREKARKLALNPERKRGRRKKT